MHARTHTHTHTHTRTQPHTQAVIIWYNHFPTPALGKLTIDMRGPLSPSTERERWLYTRHSRHLVYHNDTPLQIVGINWHPGTHGPLQAKEVCTNRITPHTYLVYNLWIFYPFRTMRWRITMKPTHCLQRCWMIQNWKYIFLRHNSIHYFFSLTINIYFFRWFID